MTLTNNEIYNAAKLLAQEFGPDCEIKLPIKINFFLQKNIKTLTALAQDIEVARLAIAHSYGELSEDKQSYYIPPEKHEAVQNELVELFNLTQEIDIKMFKLDDFNNIELSYQQMNALMFMIEEE